MSLQERIAELEAERDANIKARSEVIAELKAELAEAREPDVVHDAKQQMWLEMRARAEQAEATIERQRKGLCLIIERPPGQAHRIAIRMLEAERVAP